MDLEREVDILGGTVAHEFEFAVWRDKRDDPIRVKLPQLDTLMELAVLQCDTPRCGFRRLRPSLHPNLPSYSIRIQQQPIIEPKLTFWGAGKVRPHDDLAVDVRAEDRPRGGHEEVDVLDDIDKGLVFAVFDVGAAPGEGAGGLHGDAGGIFHGALLGFDAFGGDVHFEGVGFGVLGVAEVEDFYIYILSVYFRTC